MSLTSIVFWINGQQSHPHFPPIRRFESVSKMVKLIDDAWMAIEGMKYLLFAFNFLIWVCVAVDPVSAHEL